MTTISIAIDGHSSCGKSTLAKQLAKELGYTYVDSGAMYRAIALYCMKNNIMKDGDVDDERLENELKEIQIEFKIDDTGSIITVLNGIAVEEEIRRPEVSDKVSVISTRKEVRDKLVSLQRMMAKDNGVVMDGRDIGTVVIPEAELKIFLTADVEVRTDRRLLEHQKAGYAISRNEVRENLIKRDILDSTREESPLRQADDAIVIDNSMISKKEQLTKVMELARQAIGS